LKSDPDLIENVKKVREFEGEPFAMNPIVTSEGEVLDGYNRIAQKIEDGEKTIEVFKGIKTQPPPQKLCFQKGIAEPAKADFEALKTTDNNKELFYEKYNNVYTETKKVTID